MRFSWTAAAMATALALPGCGGESAAAQNAPSGGEEDGAPTPLAACTGTSRPVGSGRMLALEGESNVAFRGSLSIDADGAPNAYHPGGAGLDHLGNAGRPGSWWALVTDTNGEPVVQGPSDPFPGFYVSRTSLEDLSRPDADPARYVNAAEVPYVVLPGGGANRLWLREHGVSLGDLAVVRNRRTGRTAYAVWADIGPAAHLGEGSIALAEALGYDNTSPRNGGTQIEENDFVVFGGTSIGWPRTPESIASEARARFESWGGTARLDRCRL